MDRADGSVDMQTDVEHAPRFGTDDGPIRRWLKQCRAFAERSALELFRSKTVLFWAIAFPAGFYLLTIAVFIPTSEVPGEVLPYVKAGTAVTYGTFGAIIAGLNAFGQQFAMDFEDDRYGLYRSLPVEPMADLVGRMAAGVALALVAVVAVMGVAVLTGAAYDLRSVASLPTVLLAIVALAVVWMVVAVLVTTAVRDTRYAAVITVSIALAAYFLTGFNGGDPSAFQGPDWLLNWLPNSLPTRLVAEHVVVVPASLQQPGGLAAPGTAWGLGVLTVYTAVALAVAAIVMRAVVYRRGVLP